MGKEMFAGDWEVLKRRGGAFACLSRLSLLSVL